MNPSAAVALPPPWQRDPLALRRVTLVVGLLVVLWPLLALCEFRLWELLEPRSLRATGRFLSQFLTPRLDLEFLTLVASDTWRTVAMASAGLALAWVIAIPLALLGTARLSVSALTGRMGPLPAGLRFIIRTVLVVLRSVPEMVWALMLVRVIGLGPGAGVLAIALTYGGMLGKVYAEILESADGAPTQALLRNGAGRLQAFFFGTLPGCADELVSYTVYRWECAIRTSVVLGFVGAGGLGQQLDNANKMLAGHEVITLLLVFMALVAAADRVSAWLRPSRGAQEEGGHRRPSPRLGLWVLLAALCVMFVASFATLPMHGAQWLSFSALAQMGQFLAEFFPPQLAPAFLRRVGQGALETLAMSALGSALAAVAGLGLALLASRPRGALRLLTRLLLNALRSVPELVWASMLLIAAGLGPMPGTLALALHTTGVLGRLMAEALENAPPQNALALRWAGAARWQVFLFATLPQAAPQLLSYTLYCWENNIRAATVLGVVGAGGLGQMLTVHLGLFQMRETGTVVLAMLALVMVVDAGSYAARRQLNR
ncbi:phosphonate transport system permease protein [Roseateles sp. YR242]|uniref:phosphonate ABC transporter, permease protein PhnE n=1 Tax=Roseateles sp. YR242 TaxID=1855305 RepID=UPI0008C06C73|nr:phosphonate ABC transporter, permease protein PhnE [Roseateles sp. YR242]SEK32877.1 phosphonate transport system permease protein [Roseateles sp. YR242]